MTRKAIWMAAVMAAGLAAFADAASGEAKTADESTDARRLRDCSERFASSVVTVNYYLCHDGDGVEPYVPRDLREKVDGDDRPSVRGANLGQLLSRNLPLEEVGYAIAANRFVIADPVVRSRWIKRIEIEFEGRAYAARELLRHPEAGTVTLETAEPVAGVKPLDFAGDAAGKPAFRFTAMRDEGCLWTALKALKGAASRLCRESGEIECVNGELALAVTSNGQAVAFSTPGVFPFGREPLAAPAGWAAEPGDSLDRTCDRLEKTLRRRILPVYLRFETDVKGTSRSSGRYSRSGSDDERYVMGLVQDGGEVFVPASLSSEETARLALIEATDPGGAKHRLEFVGSCAEWGAFVARFAGGRLPDGLEPLPVLGRPARELRHQLGFGVDGGNLAGQLKWSLRPIRLMALTRMRGGEWVYPYAGERVLLVDAEGRLVTMSLERRNAERRWNSEEDVGSATFASLVRERAFNPEYVPRGDDERVRLGWIGVETQELTREVAEEKRALEFTVACRGNGSLVSKVYPGTAAAKAGLVEGDVLLDMRLKGAFTRMELETNDYGGFDWSEFFGGDCGSLDGSRGSTPWPAADGGLNRTFSRLGIGTAVVVAWVHDGKRQEAEMTIEQVPTNFRSAPRSRNRDIGMTVCDLTFEVRSYFRIPENENGVVVLKLKDGDPAAVAGLRPYEIITEVNGKPVAGAKDFGRRIKGVRQLTFSVRRLTATRVVRIDLGERDGKAESGSAK